jgi:hypothetical protein
MAARRIVPLCPSSVISAFVSTSKTKYTGGDRYEDYSNLYLDILRETSADRRLNKWYAARSKQAVSRLMEGSVKRATSDAYDEGGHKRDRHGITVRQCVHEFAIGIRSSVASPSCGQKKPIVHRQTTLRVISDEGDPPAPTAQANPR